MEVKSRGQWSHWLSIKQCWLLVPFVWTIFCIFIFISGWLYRKSWRVDLILHTHDHHHYTSQLFPPRKSKRLWGGFLKRGDGWGPQLWKKNKLAIISDGASLLEGTGGRRIHDERLQPAGTSSTIFNTNNKRETVFPLFPAYCEWHSEGRGK